MGNIAISVEHLSKRYRIGLTEKKPHNLREAIGSFLSAPFRYLTTRLREPDQEEIIWALKDVSFEVKHGEVLGIIGRNGAGKSTLLKILSRITEPTEGRAKIYGRIGSLLEVGTGFHPELTGRENIYLNGAILGMRRTEIDRKFDEIVDFSGVAKFIDTPVKRYSSGMFVRLAFAVAAHLDPEILLVDEVLAVGDAEFQKKCLGKMGKVAKEGRTVLFISHNMAAVQSLCNRALWLMEGKIEKEGFTPQVISQYLQSSFSTLTEQVWKEVTTAPGNEYIRIRRVSIRTEKASQTGTITMRAPFVIEVEYWNLIPDTYLDVTLHIFTDQGLVAFGTGTLHEPVWHGRPFPSGIFKSVCHIPGDLLNSGIHRVNVLVSKNNFSSLLYVHEDALVFEVLDSPESRGAWYGKLAGVVRPMLKWTTEKIDGSGVNCPEKLI
jgi:lipopolysaccharide transport system ATP-binding protein